MFYYKELSENNILSYKASFNEITENNHTEITQAEYETAINSLIPSAEVTEQPSELSQDDSAVKLALSLSEVTSLAEMRSACKAFLNETGGENIE